MRAAKVQASLRIRAVSPEPSLLAHTSSESRGTFRQKARSLAPLNGWAWAVEISHTGMLEDTNSLDAAYLSVATFQNKCHSKVYLTLPCWWQQQCDSSHYRKCQTIFFSQYPSVHLFDIDIFHNTWCIASNDSVVVYSTVIVNVRPLPVCLWLTVQFI